VAVAAAAVILEGWQGDQEWGWLADQEWEWEGD
jgi:hypothetical protein